MIFTNLTAILTDKEHWKYPDTFNPENFLDDNGHVFKPESFLPFSLGESPLPMTSVDKNQTLPWYDFALSPFIRSEGLSRWDLS